MGVKKTYQEFTSGVMARIRWPYPDEEIFNWISENEVRITCNGVYVFKKSDVRLYFYYLNEEKKAVCIATVRNKNEMIIAINGFMETYLNGK